MWEHDWIKLIFGIYVIHNWNTKLKIKMIGNTELSLSSLLLHEKLCFLNKESQQPRKGFVPSILSTEFSQI